LLAVRRWRVAGSPKKFACPIVVDSLVDDQLDSFNARVLAELMLTQLCVDQGSFSRSIRLPFELEDEQVDAKYDKGVLTIRIPKPAEAQQNVRRIEVKTA
jgi:Hsp20/alpha crystallin family